MSRPATGAPSRYPTCSAEVNRALARSRVEPAEVRRRGHQALARRGAGRVRERAERRASTTTCHISSASSASRTGSGATASPLSRSATGARARRARPASTIAPRRQTPHGRRRRRRRRRRCRPARHCPVVVSTSHGIATVMTTFPLSDTAFAEHQQVQRRHGSRRGAARDGRRLSVMCNQRIRPASAHGSPTPVCRRHSTSVVCVLTSSDVSSVGGRSQVRPDTRSPPPPRLRRGRRGAPLHPGRQPLSSWPSRR